MKNVLILEDNYEFLENMRSSLLGLIDEQRIFEAFTVKEADYILEITKIDILLCDISLPDGSGLEIIKKFSSLNPTGHAIVVSIVSNPETILQAIRNGAIGYLEKNEHKFEIRNSVILALEGKSPMSASISRKILDMKISEVGKNENNEHNPLTDRETAILQLFAKGFNAAEIGVQLQITTSTVQTHAQNIYRKLGASNRSEAVFEANNLGLIKW